MHRKHGQTGALVALVTLIAATSAHAQLEPSPLPPVDPEAVAQVVVKDGSSTTGPRWYAGEGRFGGDLNGDGLADIVLPGATDPLLHIFLGSGVFDTAAQVELATDGDARLLLPEGCRLGDDRIHWTSAGDLNDDGRDDLAVGCFDYIDTTGTNDLQGAVAIYFGRQSWPALVTEPDHLVVGDPVLIDSATLQPIDGTRPGFSVTGVGDLDGDGDDELLVGGGDVDDPLVPTAWVLLGAPNFETAVTTMGDAAWTLVGESGAECIAPLLVSALGDVDGDSVPDLAAGCVAQNPGFTVDTHYSVWLGADLLALPPTITFATRSFQVQPSDQLVPFPSPFTALGDLDGDGRGEFAVTSWVDGLSAVSGRVIAGHPAPWDDVGFVDTWWLQNEGTVDPYAAWLPGGTYESADALLMAPAGDVDGDGGGDLWVRVGALDQARIGLLTAPRPADWADGSVPPFVNAFGRPGGLVIDDAWRFSLGGSADANGDGVPDLLITGGYADDAGCTQEACGGAWLILCVDADGDGVGACEGDCDDLDPDRVPGGLEQCDAVDHDCDGNDGSVDGDGDGVLVCDGDCDDLDPLVFPGAEETCDATTDLDCDGLAPGEDTDGDGTSNCDDCQPWLPTMAPGNAEVCDGLDNDCDGVLPLEEIDVDGDGFAPCGYDGGPPDCDETNPFVRPLRFEDCFNGIDDNCNTQIDENTDLDNDGVGSCDGDCNDQLNTVFPGSTEVCDGRDNNCNGVIDDSRDKDGDGVDPCAGDCDDTDASRFPGNVGQCDGEVDADCSGGSDLGDADGDGASACGGDCDDTDPGIAPGAVDWCDGIDNDCDGVVDGPFDVDVDGWASCAGDCNDAAELTFPQVIEPNCDDGIDGDCDTLVDANDPDCAEEPTPPPPVARPYGLSCGSDLSGGGGTLLACLAVLGLLGARRRRSLLVPALAFALVLPGSAFAAKKEPALLVYLSPQPDVASMQEAKGHLPKLDAAEILHHTELLPPARGLLAEGAKRRLPCDGQPPRLGSASTSALDALIELDYARAVKIASDAVDALPCADQAIPARLLPDLFYYRGLAYAAIGDKGNAKSDFIQVIGLKSDYPADPNFDPAANALLEEARKQLSGTTEQVAAYVPPGLGYRMDGRDVDASLGPLQLAPGRHVAQVRMGRKTETVVFVLEVGRPVVILRADDRHRALRDVPVDAGARAFAAGALNEALVTADVDLAALVDLDVPHEPLRYLYRGSQGAFSFEQDVLGKGGATASTGGASRGGSARGGTATGTAGSSSSGGGASSTSRGGTTGGTTRGATAGRAQGGAAVVVDRGPILRLRVSGGFALARPFPYLQIPVDIGIRLVKGLHLDLQIAAANPGPVEGVGPVWLPTGALGVSYRIPVSPFEPRFGAAVQVGLDDSKGTIRPTIGWYGLAGGDVLVPDTPLLIGFDVRAGMLGRPFFLAVSGGIGVAF